MQYETGWCPKNFLGRGDLVCLLIQALYGLKHSGVEWYWKLVAELERMGMQLLLEDPCMFVAWKDDNIMIITIYVDDILIATNDMQWMQEVKSGLASVFEMKDLGPVGRCLGIEYHQDQKDHRVHLTQQKYTKDILDRFGMQNCKPVSTPMEPGCKWKKPDHVDEIVMRKYPYQPLIGALMYIAISIRPDIAYAVNFLSQFNSSYNEQHWVAAKRVRRYLRGTLDVGLLYQCTGHSLFGVVDADWASDISDRRSYTGYAFLLAGGAVSWQARKQKTVALSSTEAEYMAIAEATKEALYLRSIMSYFTSDSQPMVLFNDNQSAQRLVQNSGFHPRTKHVDVRHHFIRQHYQNGEIDVQYMPTNEMPADMLTKGLNGTKHRECSGRLGLIR